MLERTKRAVARFPAGGGHFWELMRFDCLVQEDLSVWVVEINMSPNMWPRPPLRGEARRDDTAWRSQLLNQTLLEVGAWALSGPAAAEGPPPPAADGGPSWHEVWRGEA